MKKLLAPILMTGIALAGCSSRETAGESGAGGGKTAQVAYGYTYRFTLPGAAISTVQDRHMALCEQMGEARCRMLEMRRNTSEGRSDGSTRFIVLAGEARRFGQAIGAPVTALGGTLASRGFEAEDVTGQTAAAAEKAAEKNNSDNRAAVAALRERVAMSTVWAYYDGAEGFWSRIGAALAAGGETLTDSIVALIYFLAAALPWVIVLGSLFLAARAIGRRFPGLTARVASVSTAPAATAPARIVPGSDRAVDQTAGPGA